MVVVAVLVQVFVSATQGGYCQIVTHVCNSMCVRVCVCVSASHDTVQKMVRQSLHWWVVCLSVSLPLSLSLTLSCFCVFLSSHCSKSRIYTGQSLYVSLSLPFTFLYLSLSLCVCPPHDTVQKVVREDLHWWVVCLAVSVLFSFSPITL